MPSPLGHIDRRQPINRKHPLNTGRVLWLYGVPSWTGGGTWRDLCGRYNGTLATVGLFPTWRQTGRGDVGLYLIESDNQRVDTAYLAPTSATIAVWVRFNALNGVRLLAINRTGTGEESGLCIFTNSASVNLYGRTAGGGGWQITLGGSATPVVDTDYRIVGTYDATTGAARLYLNGVQIGSQDITPASLVYQTDDGTRKWRFGGDDTGTTVGGLISDCGLWDRALTSAEVKQDFFLGPLGYPDVLTRTTPPRGSIFIGDGIAYSTNLEAAWELDEASGNAIDSIGSNDGTEVNGVATGTGIIYATARDFDRASSERFTVADNATVSTGDIDYTFEVWFKAESVGIGTQSIVAKDDISGREFTLDIDNASLRWYLEGGGVGTLVWPTAIVAGQWYQVFVWHDSVNDRNGMSLNAQPDYTGAYSGGTDTGTALTIGSRLYPANEDHFNGLIGPVRFWKRLLSHGTRSDLNNGMVGRPLSYITGGSPPPPPPPGAVTFISDWW